MMLRRLALFFGLIAAAASAMGQGAGRNSGGSGIDPFVLQDLAPAHGNGFSVLTGKTEVALPTTGRRVLLITTGQSNPGNLSGVAAYTPANPNAIYNINIASGGVYLASDPLLGTGGATGGSFMTRLADVLITDGKANSVVIAPISIGSTLAADWAPGGVMFHRIAVIAGRIASKTQYTPSFCFILRHQGESDTIAGTSQVSYTASLTAELAQWTAVAPGCIQFVGQVSFENSVTSAGVRAAQASVVNGTTTLSLGDFDTINCTGRIAGCIDYNTAGAGSAVAIAKVPIEAYLDAH